VKKQGTVLINGETEEFESVEAFVNARMRRQNIAPTLAELRSIEELEPHIIDAFTAVEEKKISKDKDFFCIRSNFG
jgi:hypothetical protein